MNNVTIRILSSQTLSGTAGDYVTVKAVLTNNSQSPVSDIITYLSLVDLQSKVPVDLEDWSAEKGLYIGTVAPGQTLPLNWKIHFVKAGKYSLSVIADVTTVPKPEISTLTYFNVAPKHNLNPGQVLPVALGVPVVLICVFLLVQYKLREMMF